MSDLQTVGIREFRSNMHKYTGADKPFMVTSHGRPLGYYIPASPAPSEEDFTALRLASDKIKEMLHDAGITEDQAIAEFNRLRQQERESDSATS